MTQDQFSQVSENVSGIPDDNFTINIKLNFFNKIFFAKNTFPTSKFIRMTIELLQQIVVLKMSNFFDTAAKSQKEQQPGRELMLSNLHSDRLPLRHTFLLIVYLKLRLTSK